MISRLTVLYDSAVGPTGTGGSGGYAFAVMQDEQPQHMESGFIHPEPKINQTVVEYAALIEALRWLDKNGKHEQHIRFHGRTLMIVNQMTGRWIAKTDYMELNAVALGLAEKFKDIGFDCVAREKTALPRFMSEQELTKRNIEIFIPGKWQPEETKQD